MKGYIVKDNHGAITESYRKVVANIEFANIDNNIKTIMITSSLSNEGKTTTISNLASFMTDSYKNVLLIDLDLRRPTIHKHFMLSNKSGLSNLLIKKDSYRNYVHKVYERLDVITSGTIPANPAEIINSKMLKGLLKELSEDYDYIFLDTPPIDMVSDPINIATFCDAVILVIAYSETEKEIAKNSVKSLKQVNANIIGTILNKTPKTKRSKYNYNYNY